MTITYSATGLPSGVTLSSSGKFTIDPSVTSGTYTVSITTSSSVDGSTATKSIQLKLDSPVKVEYFTIEFKQNQQLTFTTSAVGTKPESAGSEMLFTVTGVGKSLTLVDLAVTAKSKSGVRDSFAVRNRDGGKSKSGLVDLFTSYERLGSKSKFGDWGLPFAGTFTPLKSKFGDFTSITSGDYRPSLSKSGSFDRIDGYSQTVVSMLGTAGLTQIVSSSADDANIVVPDIGFDFQLYGTTYRSNIFVGSNSYVTFGFGSSNYSGLGITNPGRALNVSSGDRSWNQVWVGGFTTIAGKQAYRIRWHGNNGTSGPGTDIWEVTLFSDGAIMLVIGPTTLGAGLNMLSSGVTLNTPFTFAQNSSFVWTPDGSGSYIVRTGSYS